MMNVLQNRHNRGFTLTEVVISVIIVGGIFLGIAYVYSEINAYYQQQVYVEDVTHYGNTWADEIADYIKKASEITLTSRDGYRVVEIEYPRKNNSGQITEEKVKFLGNRTEGLYMDHSIDSEIEAWKFKSFRTNTAQYELEYFWVDPMPAQLGNYSQGLNDVRKATFDIELEIKLTTVRKKLEFSKIFKFKRRVFAANVFL